MKKKISIITLAVISTTLFSCSTKTKELSYDEAKTTYEELISKSNETFKNIKTFSMVTVVEDSFTKMTMAYDIDRSNQDSLYYYSCVSETDKNESIQIQSSMEYLIVKKDDTSYNLFLKANGTLTTTAIDKTDVENITNSVFSNYNDQIKISFPDESVFNECEAKFYLNGDGSLTIEGKSSSEGGYAKVIFDSNGIRTSATESFDDIKVTIDVSYNGKITRKTELTI